VSSSAPALTLAALTADIAESIVVLSPSARYQLLAGASEVVLGLEPYASIGRSFVDGVVPEDRDRVRRAIAEAQAHPRRRVTVDFRFRGESDRPVALRATVVDQCHVPDIGGVVVTSRVLTPAKVPARPRRSTPPTAPVEHESRDVFLRHLQQLIDSPDGTYTVLALNITNFPYVAAGLGHKEAERLLPAIIERLQKCLRPGDSVTQSGRHEVAVLLEGVQDEPTVQRFVERLRTHLRSPLRVGTQEVVAAVTIGFASSERTYATAEGVLADAQAAVQRGGARARAFDSNMRADYRRSIKLAASLPKAFQRHELQVRYQPIVRLDTGAIGGFEALCRWRHPELGIISPSSFIPLAEQLDWVVPLDRWMLEAGCQQLKQWGDREDLWLSINVSGRHLDDDGLVDAVKEALQRAGVHPGRLRLEITETAIADSVDTSARVLQQLKELGVGLAIDDFGTGYASFGQLSSMPVDALKIDGSFIAKLEHEHGRSVVQGIVQMGHELGLTLVAERVETASQLHMLRTTGCDYAQGFYFAKPLTAELAVDLLSRAPRW
jgi:diguanylate cyclase (GGDEF)-like protein